MKRQEEKGKSEKGFSLDFLTDWKAARQKPVHLAIVMTLGFWLLFICIPAIFIQDFNRVLLVSSGLLYCGLLSFLAAGLTQYDFLYRYVQWCKKHKKIRIIIAVGLLFLGCLFFLMCKMWPESVGRIFFRLPTCVMMIAVSIVLVAFVGVAIGGWVKYVRRANKRTDG